MKKISRNDLCPCGSGKKYKQCCMSSESGQAKSIGPDKAAIRRQLQAAHEFQRAGNLQQAEAMYQQILQTDPNHTEALYFSGVIACQLQKYEVAIALIGRAVKTNPKNPAYHNDLALALHFSGKLDEAVVAYRQALVLKPNFSEAHNNLGLVLQLQDKLDEARESFKRAILFKPDYPEAHNNLGNVFFAQRDFYQAIASYRRACAINPNYAKVYNHLGQSYLALAKLGDALASYRQAIALMPNNAAIFSDYLLILQYDAARSREDIFAGHVRFSERFELPLRQQWPEHKKRNEGHKLKVGFVSGDLSEHPVGFFLEGVLARLDRDIIDIVLYPTHAKRGPDALTERLKNSDLPWHSLVGLSDVEACQRIRNDAIDILIDLSGHTGNNRLTVFARKPAPVQVAWLGYWATTGLQAMDYILGDRQSIPADEERYFVERPWHLPDTRLCFTPPRDDIAVGTLPALNNGYVTFGCFNNLIKINDAVIALWATILRDVPDARLFLKNKQLDQVTLRQEVLEKFVKCGVTAERIILEGLSPRAEYFSAYHRVDIALDPFPFTGATTSVEGLWMGVPLITRKGDRLVAHQGESILHNLGMTDWIAADDDAYVALAVAHAADLAKLAELRGHLRTHLLASPLCDAPRFARNLETAFDAMWQDYCKKL